MAGYGAPEKLADRIRSSLDNSSRTTGVTPHAAFWTSIVQGNQAVEPATAVPWHSNERTETTFASQIRFQIKNTSGRQLYPSDIDKVRSELSARIDQGTSSITMKGGDIPFSYLAGYMPMQGEDKGSRGEFLRNIGVYTRINPDTGKFQVWSSTGLKVKSLRATIGTSPPQAVPLQRNPRSRWPCILAIWCVSSYW